MENRVDKIDKKKEAVEKDVETKAEKDRGPFYWKHGDMDAKLGGVAFFRYSATRDDRAAGYDNSDGFDLWEAKPYLKGHFTKNISYFILGTLRREPNDRRLYDAFVKFDKFPFDSTYLKAGQFKVPFSYAGLMFKNPAPDERMIRAIRGFMKDMEEALLRILQLAQGI